MNKDRELKPITIIEGYQPESLTTHGKKTPLPEGARLNLQKLKPPRMESAVQLPKNPSSEKK